VKTFYVVNCERLVNLNELHLPCVSAGVLCFNVLAVNCDHCDLLT